MYNQGGSPTISNCRFIENFTRQNGSGMCNVSASPTVTCTSFTGNTGEYDGGGMYNLEATVTLVKCDFTDNVPASERGGGMFSQGCSLLLCESTFAGNQAHRGGGAMYNVVCPDMSLFQCKFSGNKANNDGGGMYNDLCDGMELVNCGFFDNVADSFGGGIINKECRDAALINCTLGGNAAAGKGGGIYNGLGSYADGIDSTPLTISNSILWDNSTGDIDDGMELAVEDCELYINDTILRGGEPLIGTLGTIAIHENNVMLLDPMFVNAANGDYHLLVSSPAINAGNNTAVSAHACSDLDGNPRFFGPVDLGAYEIGFAACVCAGDLNEDGWLSPLDLSDLVTALLPYASNFYWKQAESGSCGDLTSDSWLSAADISALVSMLLPHASNAYWKQCPEQ